MIFILHHCNFVNVARQKYRSVDIKRVVDHLKIFFFTYENVEDR